VTPSPTEPADEEVDKTSSGRPSSRVMVLHPIQRRFRAEDLTRLRPADEQRRYVASQRAGRIDPNPHQIEAVIFALERIPEGGCILADEVGLGKTIEAGLVIAQLLAEGSERVLLVTPKALLGQWRQELFTLFGIEAREWAPGVDLASAGVYLVTRDFAGGESGSRLLGAVPPFDLCVIDEAHEVFAGIYKRFDGSGAYLSDSDQAKMAGRVREVLRGTPVLLLTATPIQNTLTELWGLAQFVEPTGTLLGDLATFRAMFCAGDDRRLAEGQEHELQRRVRAICRRTLRRQAQEFMPQPFVGRTTRLFEYEMSAAERALYEDVTAYLLEPGILAFSGSHSQLLLIGFHRRMASSLAALAASLERVAERLERLARGDDVEDDEAVVGELLGDLELDDDDMALPEVERDGPPPASDAFGAEQARVRGYIERAKQLAGEGDAKLRALRRALAWVFERAAADGTSDKVVVFTESVTTQDYLREQLVASGLVRDDEVTVFRGTNDGHRAARALERWRRDTEAGAGAGGGGGAGRQPSREIAVRLALVHEFRTHSRVFVSTEAGAKGLNLQFAGTLVNYDLPWNPQRIEQRIGRIHRYGQTRDVLVVNFVAAGNQAEELLLEILMRKLDMFGTVLGASDEVLHEPSGDAPEGLVDRLGPDFEAQLMRIHTRARTQEERAEELRALRERVVSSRERYEAMHARTVALIESRFDEQVRAAFRRHASALASELAAFDRDLEAVVTGWLDVVGARWERRDLDGGVVLSVAPLEGASGLLADGVEAFIGDARGAAPGVEPLHLGHPLVQAAVDEARAASDALEGGGVAAVAVRLPGATWRGRGPGERGRLRLVRVRHRGYAPSESLLPIAVFDSDGEALPPEAGSELLALPTREELAGIELSALDDDEMDDAVDEVLFDAAGDAAERERTRFDRALSQIETALEDRTLLLERRRAQALERVRDAERQRDAAVGAELRNRAEAKLRERARALEALEEQIERLRRRDDPEYARWTEQAHARRSRAPEVEVLADVRFVLEGAHE
jgi:hypothetical protein